MPKRLQCLLKKLDQGHKLSLQSNWFGFSFLITNTIVKNMLSHLFFDEYLIIDIVWDDDHDEDVQEVSDRRRQIEEREKNRFHAWRCLANPILNFF